MGGRDRDLTGHILLAAQRLEEMAGASRDYYEASWMVRATVERQLQVIGEVADKLFEEFSQQRPCLPLDKARAMRNLIAHDYDDIDRDLVWEASCVSAPDLAAAVFELADDTNPLRGRPGINV